MQSQGAEPRCRLKVQAQGASSRCRVKVQAQGGESRAAESAAAESAAWEAGGVGQAPERRYGLCCFGVQAARALLSDLSGLQSSPEQAGGPLEWVVGGRVGGRERGRLLSCACGSTAARSGRQAPLRGPRGRPPRRRRRSSWPLRGRGRGHPSRSLHPPCRAPPRRAPPTPRARRAPRASPPRRRLRRRAARPRRRS